MTYRHELLTVYEAPIMQAEVVAGALRAAGITATVQTGHFEATAHPGLGNARVMVRAEDAARARKALKEFEG
jgi:hypothetical protein